MLLGLVATLAICIGALLGGLRYETHLPGAWFFGMPGGLFGSVGSNAIRPPIDAMIAVYGGLALLTRVWLGFLRQISWRPGFPVKKVVLVVAVWAIPILLAPPLFSRDVYSYAGQGEMVSHHINPYEYGTGILGTTPFNTLGDVVWTDTPTPYGPTFLAVDGALDRASGHRILPDLVLLRLLELASLGLIAASLPTLARSMRRDPAETVLLGAGCPLVLMTLVGGAHNDALMMALLMAGLALAQRGRTVPGLVLCALAAGVKSPAALGVLFVGWVWAGAGASVWRRLAHTALAGVIGLCSMEVITLVSGTGWGWIRSSTAADQSFTGVTPVDTAARFITWLGDVVRLHLPLLGTRNVVGVAGLVLAAGIGLWLLTRAPIDGIPRTLGLTLLVVALLGPILWSWYVTWGVIALAAAASPRLRRGLIVLSTVEVFVGVGSVRSIPITMYDDGLLASLILVASLMALIIIPLGQFSRWHLPGLRWPAARGMASLAPTTRRTD